MVNMEGGRIVHSWCFISNVYLINTLHTYIQVNTKYLKWLLS